jgi:hypothetical protein
MRQSRTMSLIESSTNIAVGLAVSLAAQIIVFPWFDIHISVRDDTAIALIFTVISLVRSYCLRRVFEGFRQPDRLILRRKAGSEWEWEHET